MSLSHTVNLLFFRTKFNQSKLIVINCCILRYKNPQFYIDEICPISGGRCRKVYIKPSKYRLTLLQNN